MCSEHSTDIPDSDFSPAVGLAVTWVTPLRAHTLEVLHGELELGDTPLGITLYDVKETDENGEKLIYNPRKAAELQAVVSGQAVPVVTRGVFLYNGIGGTPAAGGTVWTAADGALSATSGTNAVAAGKFLGVKDADDNVLIKLEL